MARSERAWAWAETAGGLVVRVGIVMRVVAMRVENFDAHDAWPCLSVVDDR